MNHTFNSRQQVIVKKYKKDYGLTFSIFQTFLLQATCQFHNIASHMKGPWDEFLLGYHEYVFFKTFL